MIYVSAEWFLFQAVMMYAIGYTLLNYSRDGDLNNTEYFFVEKSKREVLERLEVLISTPDTTWNISMGIAMVSATAFMGLPKSGFASWFIAAAVVFFAQDTYVRWKTAHRTRRHVRECKALLDSLK
jgi:hypothetical protein